MSKRVRLALAAVLAAAFVAGAVYLWQTGSISSAGVRAWLADLGPAAPLLFVAAFVGGAFIGLPGVVFVVGACMAFGPVQGFALGYTGGMLATFVPFVAARGLKREPVAWRPRQRLLAKAFDLLETHPFRAVVVVRLVVWFSPPVSYALALTGVRARTYVAGCALALAPVCAIVVAVTDQVA